MSRSHEPATRVAGADLQTFMERALARCEADEASCRAVARALVTASRMGTDSHGLRLLPHYVRAVQGGRINPRPAMRFTRRLPGTGYLDADDGFGHLAGFTAIEHAISMAEEIGIGAVAVGRSSHFGAAGCYALEAAQRGYVGLSVCNADALVSLHHGQGPFYGTNPIAFAAPVPNQPPYLLDMATSSIPWNRVKQYAAIGRELPPDVVVDRQGNLTTDASQAVSLLPLGGADFGFKGAGLAGMVEVLSATLTGMIHGFRMLPMSGEDMSTPRGVGHFFLVMRPDAFVERDIFDRGMLDYLEDLRAQPALEGREVLAPGDREWRCQARRDAEGIPLDSANVVAYAELAEELAMPALS
ncbi:Ldh family oxidoreductase [Billgrantia diversa]|uniref:Ldh family oxidoreductase n=1 Tax=Halomonas sp. MCCC 1A13316 TaxID=2733487 RepID=UPI0018A63D39|nr:Ldh family oxidoreductase [Halomonas sp. MCCC 1A13316]QOR38988.1 Ldh family oxidoreductase [Halomonas sp. MCCC 1A13316]